MKRFKATKKGEEHKKESLSRKGRNSRNKGASFEREVAAMFEQVTGHGFVRTPQSGGFHKNKTSAEHFRGDIVPADRDVDFIFHVETKNAKTWSFPKWMAQAEEDAPEGKTPLVVAHKFGTSDTYALININDLLKLIPPETIASLKDNA